MLFYDFEVTAYDWLVVAMDMEEKKEHVIVNDPDALLDLYEKNRFNVWAGFNNVHYDQYIQKSIMLGINPKSVSDFIIVQKEDGWKYSREFRKIQMINYDVMMATGRIGLKTLEGFMGEDITESSVDFRIQRKLTESEIREMVDYCRKDVTNTINAFMYTIDVWNAMLAIVRAFPEQVNLFNVGDSEAQITAKVLGCVKRKYDDEFDYYVLPCIRLKKYKFVQEWFEATREEAKKLNMQSEDQWTKKAWYKTQSLEVIVAGVPHTFGFGGLHGAEEKPVHLTASDGAGYHIDVNNYYPSLLIAHGLVTRSATNNNYQLIYSTRKELKAKQKAAKSKDEAQQYKKMQIPYKKMLNALSGAMKDPSNPAYDPRNNNIMCINGQLMLLDLVEHLEVIPGFRLVQSNTDGLVIWIPDTDEAFDMLDDICYEWEKRCSTDLCDIGLAFDALDHIYQKDVNNYLFVGRDGSVERIGRYLKQLSPIDNDLPILNKALTDYMVSGVPVEKTIGDCDELGMFQKVVKLSDKYDHIEHEELHYEVKTVGVRVKREVYEYHNRKKFTYKSYRVFASKSMTDGRLLKVRSTGKAEKFGGTPDHCFIHNGATHGVKVPANLDKDYYIKEAKRTLKMFGIEV